VTKLVFEFSSVEYTTDTKSSRIKRLPDYSYAGQSPAVKEQIAEMAMNASGIRDTARVLKISPTTVISELKKKNLHCKR
jgi:transposase-like protein